MTPAFCAYFCPNSVRLGASQLVLVRRKLFVTRTYRGSFSKETGLNIRRSVVRPRSSRSRRRTRSRGRRHGWISIVTSNVYDFPRHLLPKGLAIQEPGAFAAYAVDVDPVSAARAVETIAGRSRRRGSSMTPKEVLERLDRLYDFQDATAPIRALLL